MRANFDEKYIYIFFFQESVFYFVWNMNERIVEVGNIFHVPTWYRQRLTSMVTALFVSANRFSVCSLFATSFPFTCKVTGIQCIQWSKKKGGKSKVNQCLLDCRNKDGSGARVQWKLMIWERRGKVSTHRCWNLRVKYVMENKIPYIYKYSRMYMYICAISFVITGRWDGLIVSKRDDVVQTRLKVRAKSSGWTRCGIA